MNIFSSPIIEQYIHKYHNKDNVPIEDIDILESVEHPRESSTTIVHYRIGEYDNGQTLHIPITKLIDFIFIKFEEIMKSI